MKYEDIKKMINNIADDILLMKEGHILFQKTVTDTLQELKGHVYELLTAENEREIIEKNYTVVNCKRVSEGILFRLLSDDMKDKRSIVVEPTLDDVYLSYFHEEAEYVETNLLWMEKVSEKPFQFIAVRGVVSGLCLPD